MAVAIREQVINSERVIFLGPGALVASKSAPGTWSRLTGAIALAVAFSTAAAAATSPWPPSLRSSTAWPACRCRLPSARRSASRCC
jgi:hypothetical protein